MAVESKTKRYAGATGAAIDIILILFFFALPIYLVGLLEGAVVGILVLIIVLVFSIRVVSQWNRMAVLRFGRTGNNVSDIMFGFYGSTNNNF